jgi:secondary thiamine-phosphate synthase enzyme
MRLHQQRIEFKVPGPGLHEITGPCDRIVRESGLQRGLCHVFVGHTSASLLIQENADPTARRDLEHWFDRLAPENDPLYVHVTEGADDMPAHLKSAVTSTSELIPIVEGRLGLGTWQGLYLFEHRRRAGPRRLTVTLWGD